MRAIGLRRFAVLQAQSRIVALLREDELLGVRRETGKE
jgi:hypothetical protein